jgi:hypothetical protein
MGTGSCGLMLLGWVGDIVKGNSFTVTDIISFLAFLTFPFLSLIDQNSTINVHLLNHPHKNAHFFMKSYEFIIDYPYFSELIRQN